MKRWIFIILLYCGFICFTNCFAQNSLEPIKIETKKIKPNALNHTEWEEFIVYKQGENLNIRGGVYRFSDTMYTVENKDVDIKGSDFSYDKYLEAKKEYNNNWYRYESSFSIEKYLLHNDFACYALDYKDRRADNIIVSLTDSLLIFCEPDDIEERTDGFYAYDYRKFLSSKYLIKRGFVERNFMPRVRKNFVHNHHSLQDDISIDTLSFDIKEWITSNLKIPRDYKGKIVKYVTNVQLVFNRKGEVTDVCFDKIFDQELADYIANELKKMPSVGTLAPKKEYPVSHYKNYTFKTSQSIKIKLER